MLLSVNGIVKRDLATVVCLDGRPGALTKPADRFALQPMYFLRCGHGAGRLGRAWGPLVADQWASCKC